MWQIHCPTNQYQFVFGSAETSLQGQISPLSPAWSHMYVLVYAFRSNGVTAKLNESRRPIGESGVQIKK